MKSLKEKSIQVVTLQPNLSAQDLFWGFFKALCKVIRKTDEWIELCLWKMSLVLGAFFKLRIIC